MSVIESKESLYKMLAYYIEIENFTQGFSQDDFLHDIKTVRAVTNNLIQLGELTTTVDNDIKATYPQVQWRGLKVIRNRLAHDYEEVTINRIWDIAKKDLPSNITVIRYIYDEFSKPKPKVQRVVDPKPIYDDTYYRNSRMSKSQKRKYDKRNITPYRR